MRAFLASAALLCVIAATILDFNRAELLDWVSPDINAELIAAEDSSWAPQPVADTAPRESFQAAMLEPAGAAPSHYLQAERQRYRKLLQDAKAEVLFAPCTLRPIGVGFDRIERQLISYQLAFTLQRTGNLKVANPIHAARAVGVQRQAFTHADAADLASELGLRVVVLCRAGYQQAGLPGSGEFQFRIAFERYDVGANGVLAEQPRRTGLERLAFTHTNLPHAVIRPLLPGILAELGFDAPATAHPAPFPATAEPVSAPIPPAYAALPAAPVVLLEVPAVSPEAALWQLAYLGSLFPVIPEAGYERVFMQALLGAYELPATSPSRALLIARSLYALGRRPAAIEHLEGRTDATALALRAALDGNLPGVDTALEAIPPGIPRLLAEIDRSDLRFEYNALAESRKQEYDDSLSESLPEWAPFLRQRLATIDPWRRLDQWALKRRLDEVFPLAGFKATDLVQGRQVLGESNSGRIEALQTVNQHIARLLQSQPQVWCCDHTPGQVDRWDLIDLFESAVEAELVRDAEFLVTAQGQPERGLNMLRQLDLHYGGHPDFARLRATAEIAMAATKEGLVRDNLLQAATQSIRDSVLWADGQTWASALAIGLLNAGSGARSPFAGAPTREALVSDFPTRPFWPPFSHGGDRYRILHTIGNRLLNSTWHFSSVEHALYYLGTDGSPDNALELIDSLGERFSGSDRKAPALANFYLTLGRIDDALAHLENAIQETAPQFAVVETYATVQIKRGQYARAHEAVMNYLAQDRARHDSAVGLSNGMYAIGSLFFWRGLTDYARELYKLAVDFGSTSAGDLAAQQRLAILEHDYAAATQAALNRANRYRSVHAYRDYLSFLFAFGYHDEGWAAFDVLLTSMNNAQLWEAADIGHRLDAAADSDILQRLQEPRFLSAPMGSSPAGVGQILRFFVNGRAVDEAAIGALSALTQTQVTHRSRDGNFTVRRTGRVQHNLSIDDVVGPSYYRDRLGMLFTGETQPIPGYAIDLPDNELPASIPSEYVLFAQAYSARRNGLKAEAADFFETLASHYNIEHPRLRWMLPYFSASIAARGPHPELLTFLGAFPPIDHDFDWHLSMAFVSAQAGDNDKALFHLDTALDNRPHTDQRPVLTTYQWAEACEALSEMSPDPRFRDRLLDWSRKVQQIIPYLAWPYAIEAQYTEDPHRRRTALGMALYLDPNSIRLRAFDEKVKADARKAFDTANPFRAQPREDDSPSA